MLEFSGIPGTGKTSIAEEVMRGLADRNAVSLNAPILRTKPGRARFFFRLQLALLFAAARPWMALRVVATAARFGRYGAAETRMLVVNLFAKCYLMIRALKHGGVAISDEGLVHALWSLGFTARRPDELIKSCWNLLRPIRPRHWAVAIVTAPPDVVGVRLMRDPDRNRLGMQFREEGVGAIHRAQQVMNTIVECIRDDATIRMIVVANPGASGVERAAQDVLSAFSPSHNDS